MTVKKLSRIIAVLMLLLAIGFFCYAVTHPVASFPWGLSVTYTIYGVYLLVMAVLFAAPREIRKPD